MNLPNYFLADLPPDARLTENIIQEACVTLKRNRENYLKDRKTESLIRLVAGVAENWLHPDYPFRKHALEHGPARTGFSKGTLTRGLDSFFREITQENLRAWLAQDLGNSKRLDEFCGDSSTTGSRRSAVATGPELVFNIVGGCIPNAACTQIIAGILLRSAQFVKCSTGTSFLPSLFAHSLYDTDAKLASCLELAEWQGGSEHLENPLIQEADCITVSGTDETVQFVRNRLPMAKKFVGYGHRVSFAFISAESLSGFNSRKTALKAAHDVTAWDQLGCRSPHVIYVQQGGAISAEQFAELLAEELARFEETQPRGPIAGEAAAMIASRRAFYEIRAAHSPDTRHWISANSTAWTVVYEASPLFQLSCLNRFIYVKAVANIHDALQGADAIRGHVSSVGLAAVDEEENAIATALAHWGVTRVCPLGKMQEPSLLWRHDGRPALGGLVTWTDHELK